MKIQLPLPTMKARAGATLCRIALVACLMLCAHESPIFAATSTPPDSMTYQGFLVDANGAPLAQSNPQNYPVAFRIYSTSSGAAGLLWSEQQIVTVDKGSFSVMLGDGTAIGGEPRPALSSIFTGASASDRYISAWVTIGGNTTEILPRLRLVPSPYSFLATSAANLVQPNGSAFMNFNGGQINLSGGNVGIGTIGAAGKKLQIGDLSAPNSEGMIRFASRSGTGGAARTWDIGVPETDESTVGIGYSFVIDDPATAGVEFMIQFGSGNVGIGTTNPLAKLDVNGNIAMPNQGLIQARNNGGVLENVFWPRWNDNVTYLNYGSGGFNLRNNSSASTMFVQDNGNVGIGTLTPANRLQVNPTFHPAAGYGLSVNNPVYGANIQINRGPSEFGLGLLVDNSGNGDANASLLLVRNNAATSAQNLLNVRADGNVGILGKVGIGTDTTAATLQVHHTVNNPDPNFNLAFYVSRPGANILTLRPAVVNGPFNLELWEGQAYKPNGGAWAAQSDVRLKKDVRNIDGALDSLLRLRSVTFEYKDPAAIHETPGRHNGFIAQEVEKVFPEWVTAAPDGMKAVAPVGFESLTVQALRELRKEKDDEVAALKKELGELKQEVALLKGRVSQTAQTDAMQRELDGLKQIVQQLAARNPAKTAAAKISEQTPGPSASNVADVR